jgi:hypothetical protein
MPSPASHYAEAERLLTKAADCVVASITRQLVDLAQVHATLATCYEPDGDYDPETAVDCMLARTSVETVNTTNDRL